ncbi:MAG: peptide chain release factor N(5)-glutamine methyltransferase [Mastigocoleus sp. MO_167.B18]|nr:peptide chain release factor N(5)-glutamine methyltransferase [Mastigocoleus sp. MO_167.B18]
MGANKQLQTISGLQLWRWRKAAISAAITADVPVVEIDWLLQEITDLDKLALRLGNFKNKHQIQSQLNLEDLEQLWQKRIKERLPVQYIAGATPWRKFHIAVSPAVLIPRPETEYLIDLAVNATLQSSQLQKGNWADLGTGSGAIALGLADTFTEATIHAVDYSMAALEVAQKNAINAGLIKQINFYQGCWWEPLKKLSGEFSGMLSNPPYIPKDTIAELQPEVAIHEPHLALDGGDSGLDCIFHLAKTAPTYLKPGGVWLVEMMAGQADAVREILISQGEYENIQIHTDLSGIERFAVAYKKQIYR